MHNTAMRLTAFERGQRSPAELFAKAPARKAPILTRFECGKAAAKARWGRGEES